MRGAVLYGPRDVRFEKRETPKIIQPTDAIIRISAACVCGSDLWPYRRSPDARFGGARTSNLPESAARTGASRRWFLPSQNRTSIRSVRSRRTVTED